MDNSLDTFLEIELLGPRVCIPFKTFVIYYHFIRKLVLVFNPPPAIIRAPISSSQALKKI